MVSVGETNAAQPLIEHYLKARSSSLGDQYHQNWTGTGQIPILKAPYLDLFQAVYLPADQNL